ncbi:MAG: YitT family protein [Flavobacteriales bacterium]
MFKIGKSTKREALNVLFILLGSIVVTLGIVGFLTPNKIAMGGTSGLSIILYYLLEWPMGILLLGLNLPILLLTIKHVGRRFIIKSVLAMVLLSVFIDVFNEVLEVQAFSENLMLSTIYGGLMTGVGLGLIFKGEASAGGGTLIARVVSNKTDLKPGTVILMIDVVVVAISALVFKNLELALWSIISIYVTSKFVDLIVTGKRQNKIVHIAATNLDQLNVIIHQEMGISGTIIRGDNLNYSQSRNVIFLSVSKNRIMALKNIVEEYDQSARMVVFEATEVLSGAQ